MISPNSNKALSIAKVRFLVKNSQASQRNTRVSGNCLAGWARNDRRGKMTTWIFPPRYECGVCHKELFSFNELTMHYVEGHLRQEVKKRW